MRTRAVRRRFISLKKSIQRRGIPLPVYFVQSLGRMRLNGGLRVLFKLESPIFSQGRLVKSSIDRFQRAKKETPGGCRASVSSS
jgi:hypothetical protein